MSYTEIDFNNKTILITGGAGFIGSNLALYFQKKFSKSKIVIFDSFRNDVTFSNGNLISFGHFGNLIGFKGDIICGNINNQLDGRLLDKFKFDFIFHQAAISDTRIYNQEIIMKTNVNSFYDLLFRAKKDGASMIYASSAATYGNLPSPQTVGYEQPENPYGFSKYAMDQIAIKYSKENPSLSIVGLRLFNVFGPNEFYKAKTASMVSQLGLQILNGEAPRLFKNSAKIFRDFIYIEDVIQGFLRACSPKKNGIYNIGTGISRSFQEIADILQKEFGTNLDCNYFSNPFDDYQTHTQANIKDSTINLGFIPNYSLEQGIKSYSKEIKRLHKSKII